MNHQQPVPEPTDALDLWSLARAMEICGMTEIPAVMGDPNGTRASGDCVCDRCGQKFLKHPLDWRVIGYGDRPFLHILCDGSRVKL